MTWLAALLIGLVADLFIAALLIAFVRADRVYQAEKLDQLRAEGMYWPESVHMPDQVRTSR